LEEFFHQGCASSGGFVIFEFHSVVVQLVTDEMIVIENELPRGLRELWQKHTSKLRAFDSLNVAHQEAATLKAENAEIDGLARTGPVVVAVVCHGGQDNRDEDG
jgi:hypothetical protein